jgi:hypothetical protein
MLTTCIKHKTGRIPLRRDIRLDDLKSDPDIYSTYGYQNKMRTYNCVDVVDNYYISKVPGLKCYGSKKDQSDFDLLAQRYVMIDGDLYGNDYEVFGRCLHLNRLRWHAQQKRTKVVAEKVERFIKWMETLTMFKHELYKFGSQQYNQGDTIQDGTNQYSFGNIFALIIRVLNAEISTKTLPKIKQCLIKLEAEKSTVMKQGKVYLKQIKEQNLAARTLAEIKGN